MEPEALEAAAEFKLSPRILNLFSFLNLEFQLSSPNSFDFLNL